MRNEILRELNRMKTSILKSWYRLRALKSLTKLYIWSKTLSDPDDQELARKYYNMAHYHYTHRWGQGTL